MKKSITIFVPAYNEEKNLRNAVNRYNKIVKEFTKDYELLIIDDGSKDKTGIIADDLAKKNKKVRVVHNKKNKGLGFGFRKAVQLARKKYFIFLTGEGETLDKSIRDLLSKIGQADIIVGYIGNPQKRSWIRRVISSSFTKILNITFGLHLKYFNGQNIHKTANLRKIPLTTDSFAYQAEALIRTLKSRENNTYIEVPFYIIETTGSSCFSLKNIRGVFTVVGRLIRDIYFSKNTKK